jgi:hypothetical protein
MIKHAKIALNYNHFMEQIMKNSHQLSHRASLIYGATLLPINTFLKLYLRDQERYEAMKKQSSGQSKGRGY